MSPTFRVLVCSAPQGISQGYVDLQEMKWNEPVTGIASLTGKAFVQPSQNRDRLAAILVPDAMALYVATDDRYWFGGLLSQAPWNPNDRCYEVTATAWKGWLQRRAIGPNKATNPVSDVVYSYTATDQLAIAQAIVTAATAGVAGAPAIVVGSETSGVNRDLAWQGSDFKYAFDLIDSMAVRDRGFDWDIAIQRANIGGLPVLYFAPYYPQRGASNPALALTARSALSLRSTGRSGNCTISGNIVFDAANHRTRIWATGKGSPPDRKMAYDEDPGVAAGSALLSESVTGYTGVDDVTVLAANARAERNFRSHLTGTLQVRVNFADIDPTVYGSGDRAQFVYEDEGISLSLPAVRIIDRQLNVGVGADTNFALLTLDLADFDLPTNTSEA